MSEGDDLTLTQSRCLLCNLDSTHSDVTEKRERPVSERPYITTVPRSVRTSLNALPFLGAPALLHCLRRAGC